MPDLEAKYGYPHCTGHRSSLAGGLYNGCRGEAAIAFHFGHTVVSVDGFAPRPQLTIQPRTSGAPAFSRSADVLLAADGIKSPTRDAMLARLGRVAEEADTGQAAYRIMLRREAMARDAEMLALLDSDTVVRWIGERRHIIAYAVAGHSIYNLSSAQPDAHFAAAPSATYTTRGSKAEMLAVFADFCPLVQRMLALVPDGEVCEWRLRQHRELPTWVLGAAALLGDACHPTLPHLSQGAAMAIEDGAVLAEVLSRLPPGPGAGSVPDPAAIHRGLKVY